MRLRYERVHINAQKPRQVEGDAGLDLHAVHDAILQPGSTELINTGLRLELPAGHCALVLSRSGLALHHSIAVLNAPGLIDPSYRGEVGVILHNYGYQPYAVSQGDRIAQLLISPYATPPLVAGQVGDTHRGAGGFGSTGD